MIALEAKATSIVMEKGLPDDAIYHLTAGMTDDEVVISNDQDEIIAIFLLSALVAEIWGNDSHITVKIANKDEEHKQ